VSRRKGKLFLSRAHLVVVTNKQGTSKPTYLPTGFLVCPLLTIVKIIYKLMAATGCRVQTSSLWFYNYYAFRKLTFGSRIVLYSLRFLGQSAKLQRVYIWQESAKYHVVFVDLVSHGGNFKNATSGYVYVSKYIEYLNIWQLSQKCKYFYWIFFKKCLLNLREW